MGNYSRELSNKLQDFIKQQYIFFVATAPSDQGRVNLSPKGYDSLVLIDNQHLVYLDYAGSGNETANHILDNERITFMWCSFEKEPLILRVYGYGQILTKGSSAFNKSMNQYFSEVNKESVRQVISVRIEAIQTSCGYGVPLMEYISERETLNLWGQKQLDKGALDDYIDKNKARFDEKFPIEK